MVKELFPFVVFFLFRRRQKYIYDLGYSTLMCFNSMNVYELYSVAIHVG